MFYNEAKQQKSEAEQVQMKQNKRSKTKNVKQNDAKIPILKQNKKMWSKIKQFFF